MRKGLSNISYCFSVVSLRLELLSYCTGAVCLYNTSQLENTNITIFNKQFYEVKSNIYSLLDKTKNIF